jgi:transposase-like protein
MWEYFRGDRGAQKGVDRQRIAAAERELQEAEARTATVEKRICELRRERRTLVEKAQRGRAVRGMTTEDALALVVDLGLTASLLDDEQVELASRRDHVRRARCELEAARATLIPLPDDAPDPEADLVINDPNPADDHQIDSYERDWVTVTEAAEAFGVEPVTMRRWLSGRLPHKGNDPRNPWDPSSPPLQVLSERNRRLVVTDLDPSRISPTTLDALNAIRRRMP